MRSLLLSQKHSFWRKLKMTYVGFARSSILIPSHRKCCSRCCFVTTGPRPPRRPRSSVHPRPGTERRYEIGKIDNKALEQVLQRRDRPISHLVTIECCSFCRDSLVLVLQWFAPCFNGMPSVKGTDVVGAGMKAGPNFHARYFQLKGLGPSAQGEFVQRRKGAYTACVHPLLAHFSPHTFSDSEPSHLHLTLSLWEG
jgi:hypothetical protein